MRKDKISDDLTGLANAIAGLGNEVLKSLGHKTSDIKNLLKLADEVESIKLRLVSLEKRISSLEDNQKG